MALGASRASVLRLFVLESLLVSVARGIRRRAPRLAIGPARAETHGELSPARSLRRTSISLPVLAFTIALSLLTGLAMGMYPAWQSSRADLVDGLKEGGRGTSGSVRQQRFRKILVGAQVALSVTLLAGAASAHRQFRQAKSAAARFRPDHLWVGFVTFPQAHYPDEASRARFAEQTQEALRAIPGFESAAVSGDFPLAGGNGATLYARPEGNVPPVPEREAAPSHDIDAGIPPDLGHSDCRRSRFQ